MWELAEALTARGTGTALTLRDALLERVVESETASLVRHHQRPSPDGETDTTRQHRLDRPAWGHDT